MLLLAIILFLTIPQRSLQHWLNKKVDALVDVNAVELEESPPDHMPVDVYFNENKNGIDVTYDMQKKEDSNLYKIEAHYKGLTAKKDYEAFYIQTGNGEHIKNILKDYFKQNPAVIVSESDIDNLIKANLDTDYLDYSIDVDSTEDYTQVIVTTYCDYCVRRSGENKPISDYIYFEL